ncbi:MULTISPECIES: FAD-dependent monooxygenase [Streptomyces]|uniref:Monooxygenase n=1 Tax=Streptomyces tsukubensis (strain DSM 42081 / NBRC 108919 / NRRL 18488 / 9993) TaxID=1114943 RepID=I2N7J1_STRT9|nr:FAD-dependent monooxygenase [Streptomyces tsukubensis]MYS64598.1 monooxygenase [Streptomyces sp. SID5473]AZK96881.1 monooxygenase [Streptomyces tsukubensis]EIF92988.1 monooxygenase FAD-binding protein [Streptomyces tsukubensis NRRL18488]QKM67132.1 monooxygenase [Streptomyces tsukubensis NRRL18488]TAI41384.1 monooxygenase [Streptomyces tsukubensis]
MDPVIVVGAGPVGLALALALAQQGVPSVVLDEGTGGEEPRPARTVVLRPDTAAAMERLGCATVRDEGARWTHWRAMRRKQEVRRLPLGGDAPPSPLHIPQHALTRGLRDAVAAQPLVQLVAESRVDALEQDGDTVTVHTRGPDATWWRGSHVVGCDGARSTVRKLLGIRFPGRTAVERHAVATLRTELPWPDEALLHRQPSWRGAGDEIAARPLPDDVWRLDWLLPPGGDLVTPDTLVARVRDTLGAWCGGTTPPYDLLDTGVYTVHHRLARRWRVDRAFLAGDAAHLLGALGTQGLDEGLRDAENLAWKLAHVHRHGGSEALLDSYQAERRSAVAARLRAADQVLPSLRSGSALRARLPGAARLDGLLTDAHLGRGPLGAPPVHTHSPLAPDPSPAHVPIGTEPGAPVEDVRITAPDGTSARLRDRLGQGQLLVVLVAPGTGVWDRRHWQSAGVMPRLASAVSALPVPAELLVTEAYPGASAHTVLLVRPDGQFVAAFSGVRPEELYEAADAVRGGSPSDAPSDRTADVN